MKKIDIPAMAWRKSSYSNSNSNCVEVAVWLKSSRSSSNANCVEVARNLPGIVAVRDTKDRAGAVLSFAPEQWVAFTNAVKSGEL